MSNPGSPTMQKLQLLKSLLEKGVSLDQALKGMAEKNIDISDVVEVLKMAKQKAASENQVSAQTGLPTEPQTGRTQPSLPRQKVILKVLTQEKGYTLEESMKIMASFGIDVGPIMQDLSGQQPSMGASASATESLTLENKLMMVSKLVNQGMQPIEALKYLSVSGVDVNDVIEHLRSRSSGPAMGIPSSPIVDVNGSQNSGITPMMSPQASSPGLSSPPVSMLPQ